MSAVEDNRFDVAHITFQTLINTYPDSEYASKATVALDDPRIAKCGESSSLSPDCDQNLRRHHPPTEPISSPFHCRSALSLVPSSTPITWSPPHPFGDRSSHPPDFHSYGLPGGSCYAPVFAVGPVIEHRPFSSHSTFHTVERLVHRFRIAELRVCTGRSR